MSTAAEYDQPYDDDDDYRMYGHTCDQRCPADCGYDEPDGLPHGVHPANVANLDGPAVDAMYGLRQIRDVPVGEVPAGVMVQAILAAQRLASYAKAQAVYWTAAFARPGVAVPVSNLLDSIAHRADEQGRMCDIPEDLIERASAGHMVFGDPAWDAVLAAEAASFAEPELSAALLVAPITARRRIADAQELIDDLPATFQALEEGRIEDIRARVIAETTHHIDPDLRARAEQLIVERAKRGMTPGDLGRLAKKIVADLDPDAAGRRADKARAGRGTNVRDLGDDMARFTADLAAEDAALTEALLDLLAAAIPSECRQGRGISQLRADVFADVFGQLADTGLIDLRGINPHHADLSHTDPTGPDGNTDPAQPGPSETGPAEPGQAGTDPADPDTAQEDNSDTGPCGNRPDAGDAEDLQPDDDVEPEPTHNDPADADTGPDSSGSTPGESSPVDQGDPHPAADSVPGDRDDPGESAAEPAGPTAAQLWARLRSVDWESHLDADPDCPRRGGLLSMVRLPAGVRVNLDVTVALSTLAGCDDLSARLAGLGVITADTARALATAAGTVRILVLNDPPDQPGPPNGSPPPGSDGGGGGRLAVDPNDPDRPTTQHHGGIHHGSPDCGTVLDFGRTTYRPPASVIDRVDTRDQRCRFPGCPQIAERCDHDHRITWDDGGATCPCDLDALCRFHHRAKTFTAWTAIRDQKANTLTWTSPLGRIHIDRPTPDLPTGTPINLGDRPKPDDPPDTEEAPGDEPTAEHDTCDAGSRLDADHDPDDPPF